MRDRVFVVGQISLVGALNVAVDVLQLDEQQRHAVDEADDVRAPAVELPLDPQLAHAEEVVVLGVSKSKTRSVRVSMPPFGDGS